MALKWFVETFSSTAVKPWVCHRHGPRTSPPLPGRPNGLKSICHQPLANQIVSTNQNYILPQSMKRSINCKPSILKHLHIKNYGMGTTPLHICNRLTCRLNIFFIENAGNIFPLNIDWLSLHGSVFRNLSKINLKKNVIFFLKPINGMLLPETSKIASTTVAPDWFRLTK